MAIAAFADRRCWCFRFAEFPADAGRDSRFRGNGIWGGNGIWRGNGKVRGMGVLFFWGWVLFRAAYPRLPFPPPSFIPAPYSIPAKAGISRGGIVRHASPQATLHFRFAEFPADAGRDSRFRGNGIWGGNGRVGGESGNLPINWGGAGNACTAPLITCRGKPLPAFFATPASHALPLRCRCRRRQSSASPSGRCRCRSRSHQCSLRR